MSALVLFDQTYQISQPAARLGLHLFFLLLLPSPSILFVYVLYPPADRVKHDCLTVSVCVERGFFNVFRIRPVIHTLGLTFSPFASIV